MSTTQSHALSEQASRLRASGRSRESIAWYRRAIQAAPESAELHSNLGSVWMELGRFREARECLSNAIALNPALSVARSNLATVLHASDELSDALREYRCAAELAPGFIYPRVHALTLAKELVEWGHWDADLQTLLGLQPSTTNTAPQLDLLYLPLSPQQLKAHAEAYVSSMAPAEPVRVRRPARGKHIRIGYVSDELRRHATGSLMAEVLELHDRSRFDIHVYSWGRNDGSDTERRVRAAVRAFHDISAVPNRAAAERIAADGIDILIDLKGYTLKPRTEIFAQRAAPVQVSWLGYPGTLGAPYYDYIIADEFVIPPGAERFYTERVVRLPDCCQPNDRQRPLVAPRSRAEYGLPGEAVVFCYLGKCSKITPEVFKDWMLILQAVPRSVLWLFVERGDARARLSAEAARQGISSDRLHFAGVLPFADHIARFRAAHIALDTYPYGSHTTVSEALWAGCPVIARAGDTFASRVAGSLLKAACVPELITTSAKSFRELAIALGNDPVRTSQLRQRLEASRTTSALFDTPRFVRNLEAAFERMRR